MAVKSPITPRRVYHKSNICVLCGFAFIQSEVSSSGVTTEKKFFDKKLKLSSERIQNIQKVIRNFQEHASSTNGVCKKCYKSIERVLKMETDLQQMQNELSIARSTVQRKYNLTSPMTMTSLTTKRLLRSPTTQQPNKIQKNFPTTVSVLSLTTIPSFQQLIRGDVSASTTSDVQKPKAVRRSLTFAEREQDLRDDNLEGEVKLVVYYPSGKKTSFIRDEIQKQICRAVLRNQNVEKCVAAILGKAYPEIITSTVSSIVSKECESLCKRGSGSVLQDRTYKGVFEFTWDKLFQEVQVKAPHTLKVITSTISSIPVEPTGKKFMNIMQTFASALHSRNQEMSCLHYQIGFILSHGGCKQKDIERLARIGMSVSPKTIQTKLSSWENFLDSEILEIKNKWIDQVDGLAKYQLVGDNWDKNIIPSYRTTQNKTISLHLFNIIAVVDRIIPVTSTSESEDSVHILTPVNFLPSITEQNQLKSELTFIFATSVINNLEQIGKVFGSIYPTHLTHKYSEQSGLKTKQFPIGLFDCNEQKTQDVIQLLKRLTTQYVPIKDEEIVEEVFFGGDRLTDERIQGAQQAMANAYTPMEQLKGFISKIEDWHRLMNFMEAIAKLTYDASSTDRGTASFFRNFLNARSVKGHAKNAFRAYKHLYYTIFDAICCLLFLREFGLSNIDEEINFPLNFDQKDGNEKVLWLNEICEIVVQKYFFENKSDMLSEIRHVLENPDHPENYWISNEEDGKYKCHFCVKTYAYVGSLKAHEIAIHNYSIKKETKMKSSTKDEDQLYNYTLLLFKLIGLLKNLDTAIDMADGQRAVKSSKYELPIFNKTKKTKYVIGCIHLTSLAEETLTTQQRERLIANRCVNIQGGKNNNIALDEYLEMLNRDSKDIVTGHQTSASIISHSKHFPHLINSAKHFDLISNIRARKGFHKLPSYLADVKKVAKELVEIDSLT